MEGEIGLEKKGSCGFCVASSPQLILLTIEPLQFPSRPSNSSFLLIHIAITSSDSPSTSLRARRPEHCSRRSARCNLPGLDHRSYRCQSCGYGRRACTWVMTTALHEHAQYRSKRMRSQSARSLARERGRGMSSSRVWTRQDHQGDGNVPVSCS